MSQELEECKAQLRAAVAGLKESEKAPSGNTCFSQEAFDAFNSGDAYIHAAQNGLARATDQYVKDIRVRKSDDYIYIYMLEICPRGNNKMVIIIFLCS